MMTKLIPCRFVQNDILFNKGVKFNRKREQVLFFINFKRKSLTEIKKKQKQ